MKTIEITAGMTVEEIIKILEELKKNDKFKYHVFKMRGTIDLVFDVD